MSFYHVGHAYSNSMSGHHNNHHHGRSRRGQRMSSSQNAHRQHMVRTQKSPKQPQENLAFNAYVKDLEAAKSFDFEDDEIFCPFHLLTEDDLQSIHSSASSDRSSLSSASPDSSPLQHQAQPTPSFLVSGPAAYTHNAYQHRAPQHQHGMKLHQPMAQRSRNAIPIVDPSTRSVASPPPSVSPARQMQHQYGRRW
ncbi:hypothetical protein K461DRAFT_146179 [Myriangium duriaei CBS 260.36]|uniref:Uncharacterized protein n=1 Tax=Myriangium duriaei CBS 260.36 TaxID=1168546 RepID=A0A9P4J4S2_9PEZI|nr:hypothetical protein K461DRAFT_146179 [Myriangium duriaei CBS 260.36]